MTSQLVPAISPGRPLVLDAGLLDDQDLMPEPQRWAEYERRKRAWLKDNPGAWPPEYANACARLAEELGL